MKKGKVGLRVRDGRLELCNEHGEVIKSRVASAAEIEFYERRPSAKQVERVAAPFQAGEKSREIKPDVADFHGEKCDVCNVSLAFIRTLNYWFDGYTDQVGSAADVLKMCTSCGRTFEIVAEGNFYSHRDLGKSSA
jgi:hypothetical protein